MSSDIKDLFWFSMVELKNMVKENKIEDSTTLATIFRLQLVDKELW